MLEQKDYSSALALSERLIAKFGRLITLQKLGSSPLTDPQKPWLGNGNPAQSVSTVTLSTYAVSIPPSSLTQLGLHSISEDFLKRLTNIFIVRPGSDDPNNLDSYHRLVDGSVEYKIIFVDKLRPADLTLLYYIGVAK